MDVMVQVQSMKKDSTIKTGKDSADAFVNRVETESLYSIDI